MTAKSLLSAGAEVFSLLAAEISEVSNKKDKEMKRITEERFL